MVSKTEQTCCSRGQGAPVNVQSDFFLGRMAKNSGPNPRSFPKNIIYYPSWRAGKHIFTPIFRLHTVTTDSGDRRFGYFLRRFHVLIDIYPLVPFPPSLCEGVSDYTRTSLRRQPVTSATPSLQARASKSSRRACRRKLWRRCEDLFHM